MFCQNDKSEEIITIESNKQGTTKNTFQHTEEDLPKFQEARFHDVNFLRGQILQEWRGICRYSHSRSR